MRAKISSILLFLLSVLLVIGEQSFAGPCPMKPNGMYMVCHWAGQAILGVGVVVIVLSIFHICSTNRAFKQGLDIGSQFDVTDCYTGTFNSALQNVYHVLPYCHETFYVSSRYSYDCCSMY